MKIVVIGAVAAGTKTAAKLKREQWNDEVLLLTQDREISYAGCGLPYYVGGVIATREELIVHTPASFSAITGVSVRVGVQVTQVNPVARTVTAMDVGSGGQETIGYDTLVLATGARAAVPPIPGVELEGVYTMRTPDDAQAVRQALDAQKINRMAVVGGGFIGLEMAENLARRGVRVSVLEQRDELLPGFDREMALYARRVMEAHGVMALTGTKVVGIEGDGCVQRIRTEKRALKVDAVILCAGIRPNTEFLASSGINLMPDGTVRVDEFMRASQPGIYAVGDCACVTNALTHSPAWSPMGSSANIEGRLAAQNIAGKSHSYRGVLGTAVAMLAGISAGRTGLSEEQSRSEKLDAISVLAVLDDKPHYYPGAGSFIIKLIADRSTRRLLGLQVLGEGAVDKITDIAATALTLGATLDSLQDMDLAYSPVFSTAIHPFSQAVNILLNKLDGSMDSMTPMEFEETGAPGYRIVDVSKQPSIPGAEFVELAKIQGELDGHNRDEKLLLVCTRGRRAYLAQNRLRQFGYTDTKVLEGGTAFNEIEVQ